MPKNAIQTHRRLSSARATRPRPSTEYRKISTRAPSSNLSPAPDKAAKHPLEFGWRQWRFFSTLLINLRLMTTPLLIRGKNSLKRGKSLCLWTTPNWVSPTTHTLQVNLGATESDYFICQVVRSTSPSAFGPCNIGNVKEEDYFSFRKASFLAGAKQMPMLVPLLHHQNECFLGLFSSTLYCTPGPEETFPSSTQINILCDWLATRFLDQCVSGEFAPQANPM